MDIYIVLTGRRGSGKDSVADIAIKDFGCAGKVGLADWFKKELSEEFRIELHKFYSEQKDMDFCPPIVLSLRHIRGMVNRLADAGYPGTHRMATGKWDGRELKTIRQLMLWFGHDVVTQTCGDAFHCEVTEKRGLPKVPRVPGNHVNIVFITDARQYEQSKYFLDKYPFVFPVQVVRAGGTQDTHPVEASTDGFPERYFFHVVENNGTMEELGKKVQKMLLSVKKEVTKRTNDAKTQKSQ